MNKQDLIKRIKSIIEEWGPFSTSDVEAESSPVYKTVSKDHVMLIERFDFNDVTVTTYIHEMEVDETDIPYEELDNDTLEDICLLAENYEAEQIKLYDSIKDEDF